MNINISYDPGTAATGTAFDAAVNEVVAILDELFTNNITVNIQFGFGTLNGAAVGAGDLGQSIWNQAYTASYSAFHSALSASGDIVPTTNPFGAAAIVASSAEMKALGLIGASATIDGYVGIGTLVGTGASWAYPGATSVGGTQYDIMGVLLHEITEDLGRTSWEGHGGAYSVMDLFRYVGTSGAHTIDTAAGGTGSTAYFSTNGGLTNLGTWNNDGTNGDDLGDWKNPGPGPNDSFNGVGSPGSFANPSTSDILLMQALGYTGAASLYAVTDLTISSTVAVAPTFYRGTDPNLLFQYINTASPDSFDVKAALSNSLVHLGDGNNTIDFSGIGGTNVAIAGNGNNTFIGGSGNDTMTGGSGTNTFTAGSGIDVMNGGSGTNIFNGGSGTSVMGGGSGTNVFNYGAGTTTITATGSNNTFVGNALSTFAETMVGGTGINIFESGNGPDTMAGGVGANTYIFTAGSPAAEKTDTITNFHPTTDTFDVVGETVSKLIVWSPSANAIEVQYGVAQGNWAFNSYVLAQNVGASLFTIHDYANLANALSGNDANGFVYISAAMNPGAYTFTSEIQQFDANSNLQIFTVNNKDGTHTSTAFDTTNVQAWATKTDNYDTSSHLASESLTNHDGTSSTEYFDVANANTWATSTNSFDAAHNLTSQSIVNHDSTSLIIYYDPTDIQTWTSSNNNFDASHHLTTQTVIADNGTTTIVSYDTSMNITAESITTADGATINTYFDVNNLYSWSTSVTSYDAAHNLIGQIITQDNGTSIAIYYDPTNAYNWTTSTNSFDAAHNLITQNIALDDGTTSIISFDVNNASNWKTFTNNYDTAHNLTNQYELFNDNTATLIVYDVAHTYAWNTATYSYDSLGHITNVVYA